jgi:hypothetical protein
MAGVRRGLRRAARLIKRHIRENDKILRLLARTHTLLLKSGQYEIHSLLEVGAESVADVTVADTVDTIEQIILRAEGVPHRIRVKRHQTILELIGTDFGPKKAESHRDPVGRISSLTC